MAATSRPAAVASPLSAARATALLLVRNVIVYRSGWKLFLTGFLEPVFYLFSIGIGVGQLIDTFEFHGRAIPYAEFVAPGMLAASAMNGALLDATYNVFFKLRYEKLYDQLLATPLSTGDVARGEIAWCLVRGGTYSAAFLVVMTAMGLVGSWWAVLALPAALLIAFAFAAVGMALTTYLTSWQDFEKITLVQVPLFLFSATFFPISALGAFGSIAAAVLPLTLGVDALRQVLLGPAARGLLPLGVEMAILAVLSAVFLVLARLALAHLETLAKREGRLTQRWQ